MRALVWAVLAVLAAQNCVSTALIRYSKKGVVPNRQFHNSSVIFLQEVLKLIAAFLIVVVQSISKGNRGIVISEPSPSVIALWHRSIFTADAWRLSIASLLYTAQGLLGMMALNTVDPVTYQCFSQTRLLFTTVISVMVLKRVIAPMQWISLFVLTGGLVAVQSGASWSGRPAGVMKFDSVGIIYLLASSLITSYASVYLEWIMTSLKDVSVAARNVQLSLFGMMFAAVCMFLFDIRVNWKQQQGEVAQCGPVQYNIFLRSATQGSQCTNPYYVWERFDEWSTWGVIVVQSFGGLLIGFTMSLSSSVMKCLATAVSTVLSAAIAYSMHDLDYTWAAFVGGAVTLASSFVFHKSGAVARASQQKQKESRLLR